ncbi:YlbF family regulator [Lactobacillaceae bacterium 24-114]
MVNIYDTANELSNQIKETQEYEGLKKAFDALKADQETFDTFKKFQQMQADAQRKQMSGQQLTQDEINSIQTMAKEISAKPAVQTLMNQERAVDNMLQQLNRTITGPIQEIYKDVMPEGPAAQGN